MHTHPSTPHRFRLTTVRCSTLLGLALCLTACGGGGDDEPYAASPATVGSAPVSAVGTSPATGGAAALVALDASTSCGQANFRAELLQQVNAARAQSRTCGSSTLPAAGALAWNDRLFSAAARHSRDMAVNNHFSHTSLDGRTFSRRITDEGYAWSRAGENIAAGQSSVSDVVSGWLASPGHCANIMRAEFRDVAVSCVSQAGSSYGRYWTMSLARPI
ncbi:MAG: CAP domain-containing protein [Hydrogenophaga sp.]|uniref:CAP domain-containing protein n=1 Tax=Hydrogenophaga sp. TaxID=1904254 RepID=UPI00260221AF|nr:CAP domain-containing protein [Hydrogenophaga sp.]MDM7943253.1 CAP domain-containing protein [Hydrogenophaga sp.]